jgi:hypothetical protein
MTDNHSTYATELGEPTISLPPYKHRPLGTKSIEIRLLHIERSSNKDSPPVPTLQHALLSDKPAYHALSYCWGEESPLYEVRIRDGSTVAALHARQNLYDFLQTTRSWDHEWLNG